ncbi:hypothetical protein K502DRAFT_297823 [Neoconidiobolus thromboides FSU 785]|nr:hypothetical protein K502DRAFT_297823 [Neoconidiobolus thromboides FSU 785]
MTTPPTIVTPTTLCQWAAKILYTEDPIEKVKLTNEAGEWWRNKENLPIGREESIPDIPPRPSNFDIVQPGRAPRRGKAGSLASRITILHALANVEQWAIDTAWDNIARFGKIEENSNNPPFPKGYYDDFVKMALDEAKHFNWLIQRLDALDAKFGDIPIHAGIWESAAETKHLMPARMAIVHMVHEARGLDVNPSTINNFKKHGDIESSTMLEKIYEDEITHVEIGTRWFKYYFKENKIDPNAKYFHAFVSKHFFGTLKPPFNYPARDQAGLGREFYEPMAKIKESPFVP